jgi:hypothetical protein
MIPAYALLLALLPLSVVWLSWPHVPCQSNSHQHSASSDRRFSLPSFR